MDGIAKLLSTDGFIQVNKALIKLLGLHEAILIGELCAEYVYWEKENKLDGGTFYSTHENIEDNTGLNEYLQRKALKNLQQFEIIEIKKKGLPAKNYYKINFDKLLNMLNTSPLKFKEQETENLNLNKNNKQEYKNNKTLLSKDNNAILENSNDFLGSAVKSKSKKMTYKDCIDLINNYTDDLMLQKCLMDYLNLRLAMKDKPMRLTQWQYMLDDLTKCIKESNVPAIEIVKNSIIKGYPKFYAVTNYNSKKQPSTIDLSLEGDSTQDTEEERIAHQKWLKEMEAKGEQTVF